MTTIHPFWFDGNGYHLFLIDGWKIKTLVGASKYLTGLDCGVADFNGGLEFGFNRYPHHVFDGYSEFYFGDYLYSIWWAEGEFRKGSQYRDQRKICRDKEDQFGWDLTYGVTSERFRDCLANRLELINKLKSELTKERQDLPFYNYIGTVEI